MQLDFFLSIVFEIDVEYGPIIIKFFLSRFEQSWKEKKSPTKNWANTFLFQMQNRLQKSSEIRTNEKSQKTQKRAQKSRVEESAFNRENALKF